MKFLIVAFFTVAVAHAGLIPLAGHIEHEVIPGIAAENLVQGPSTKTRVFGSDGSLIAADAPGGSIVAETAVPVVATPVVAKTLVAEPIVHVPSVVHQSHVVVPTLVGQTYLASPVSASGYPLLAPGSGLEGQYVPDNIERLYDDGSYKGEFEEH